MKRKLTPKQLVLRKYPDARLIWSAHYCGWAIYRASTVGRRISGILSKKEAWADAARRLKP